MRTLVFRLLLCLTSLGLTSQAWSNTLLVLGDSISAGYGINVENGWVNLVKQRLDGIEVINGSISGDTTGLGLARLPSLLAEFQPSHVIIELGGNDGLQGHPLSRMKENLNAIIQLCREQQAQPILFSMRIPPNYGKRYTERFAEVYPTLAREADVPIIPFIFESLLTTEGMIQEDGIHPTEAAQPLIAEHFLVNVQPLLN